MYLVLSCLGGGQPDDINVLNFDFVTLEPGNFRQQNGYFFLNRQFKYNGLGNNVDIANRMNGVQIKSQTN